jgi:hypothetical protein
VLALDLGSGHVAQACGALDAGPLAVGERAWPAIGLALDAASGAELCGWVLVHGVTSCL